MKEHFGIKLKNDDCELKMSRENYVFMNNKSSFKKDYYYSEAQCNKYLESALLNYDNNINRYLALDKIEFNQMLDEYFREHYQFHEIHDLNQSIGVSGYYILVLDEYCQIYIGETNNLKTRIQQHWSKKMPIDRLIFTGGVQNSRLSIDSFRALDTTRIYIYETKDIIINEHKYIMECPLNFRLNRVGGAIYKE